jgi:hypothetical protein
MEPEFCFALYIATAELLSAARRCLSWVVASQFVVLLLCTGQRPVARRTRLLSLWQCLWSSFQWLGHGCYSRHALGDRIIVRNMAPSLISCQFWIAWNNENSSNFSLHCQNLHGSEPFLRNRQFCSYSRISQHFVEPGGSLLFHRSPPMVPILSQDNPVCTIAFCHSKFSFNIIHPPTFWSSCWFLPYSVPTISILLLSYSCYFLSLLGSTTLLLGLSLIFNFTNPIHSLLARGISLSQDHSLHTGQHKRRRNPHKYPYLQWVSNQRFQCRNRRKQFVP